MLRHEIAVPRPPERVVVLGAGGFIGSEIARNVEAQGVPVLALGRASLSLLDADAGGRLAAVLKPSDALVFVSAAAPVRDATMMLNNVRMAASVCAALQKTTITHLLYISSDAVYADGPLPLNETSPAAPNSLHGAMHLTRELMLESVIGKVPYARLRPTLVYGARDPHNGYGPNRFRRLANRGEPILLFGEGEERRDHVDVADVGALATLIINHRSHGILNAATGSVTSFREIAELTVRLAGKAVAVDGQRRSGPMPHGGYRPFDTNATAAAFPDFRYTPLAEGLAKAQKAEFE